MSILSWISSGSPTRYEEGDEDPCGGGDIIELVVYDTY